MVSNVEAWQTTSGRIFKDKELAIEEENRERIRDIINQHFKATDLRDRDIIFNLQQPGTFTKIQKIVLQARDEGLI